MKCTPRHALGYIALLALAASLTTVQQGREATQQLPFTPNIPRTWDSTAMASFELPLADAKASPQHVSEDYYYQLPERVIYKSYPIYAPGREPEGYWEWLQEQEPEVVFDETKLKTEADWIKAGELLFDAPIDVRGAILTNDEVRDPAFYAYTKMPLTPEGIMPYARYVVVEKGTVLTGNMSCGMCHTRVNPDGTLLKGAQGNFPGDPATGFIIRKPNGIPDQFLPILVRGLFATPWIENDPHTALSHRPRNEIADAFDAVPSGTLGRQGTGILFPPQVPDLIGVKDRKYLDKGGLSRHRDIGDMMRYIATNQALDVMASYDGYIPVGIDNQTLPPPGKSPFVGTFDRHSEAQLYAISKYIYSLQPPANPHQPNALSKRGERIFTQQGCVSCHTPPLYTNNMLTPVDGFVVPPDHHEQYDIFDISIGTDPGYALKSRRGTGYYKIPSLRGVWYRGPFLHDGSLATLEDVLDARRLRDDYVPTGFKGAGVAARAVEGHEFGLDLSQKDKQALVAFLKTL